jgi:hypothetical protein
MDIAHGQHLSGVAVALIAAAAAAGFAALGGTEALGAHPFWAIKVGWIGALIGVAAHLAGRGMGLSRPIGVGLFAGAMVLAGLTTYIGKTRFVASFAEDAFAGRMWFLGWIAVMAAATALAASLLSRAARKP